MRAMAGSMNRVLKADSFEEATEFENMVNMLHMDRDTVLKNIVTRFHRGRIYTSVGNVLISVNPFADLGLYTKEQLMLYHYSAGTEIKLSPHIFAIARDAYRGILQPGNKPQTILVSGESGAGKTEASKLLIRYLTTMSQEPAGTKEGSISSSTSKKRKISAVEDRLLSAEPILEAFGNARTLQNNNSSRFGKFTKVHFDTKGRMISGSITSYLLEEARVVMHSKGERGFNVFYQLCAWKKAVACTEQSKPKRNSTISYVLDPKQLGYLAHGKCDGVEGIDDTKAFNTTENALESIGLSLTERASVWIILEGLLYLGNIVIVKGNSDSCSIPIHAKAYVSLAAKSFGVPAENLEKVLTQFTFGSPTGSVVTTPRSATSAIDTRDGIAKRVYGKLFMWIVKRINQAISAGKDTKAASFVGILDIFGFEVFHTNGFEQLCINYANEKLQQHFVEHFFKLELEVYNREGLDLKDVSYKDNDECINMMDGRGGLFAMLQDEGALPRGSDAGFVAKLRKAHKDSEYFTPSRSSRESRFTIKHYAAPVKYTAKDFIAKNVAKFDENAKSVLESSTHHTFAELFKLDEKKKDVTPVDTPTSVYSTNSSPVSRFRVAHKKSRKRRSPKTRKKTKRKDKTLGQRFQASLQGLLNEVKKTQSWFVRCIKSNEKRKSRDITSSLVMRQLLTSGIIDALQVRKHGYSERMPISKFITNYSCLLPSFPSPNSSPASICCQILCHLDSIMPKLLHLGSSKNSSIGWQVGKTMVFLRSRNAAKLARCHRVEVTSQSRVLQAAILSLIFKHKLEQKRRRILALKELISSSFILNDLDLLCAAAIQSGIPSNMLAPYYQYRDRYVMAQVLQAACRTWITRRKMELQIKDLRRLKKASITEGERSLLEFEQAIQEVRHVPFSVLERFKEMLNRSKSTIVLQNCLQTVLAQQRRESMLSVHITLQAAMKAVWQAARLKKTLRLIQRMQRAVERKSCVELESAIGAAVRTKAVPDSIVERFQASYIALYDARREKEEDTARRERQMELDEIKRIQLVEANSKSALDDNDSRAASEVEEAGEEAGEEDQDSDDDADTIKDLTTSSRDNIKMYADSAKRSSERLLEISDSGSDPDAAKEYVNKRRQRSAKNGKRRTRQRGHARLGIQRESSAKKGSNIAPKTPPARNRSSRSLKRGATTADRKSTSLSPKTRWLRNLSILNEVQKLKTIQRFASHRRGSVGFAALDAQRMAKNKKRSGHKRNISQNPQSMGDMAIKMAAEAEMEMAPILLEGRASASGPENLDLRKGGIEARYNELLLYVDTLHHHNKVLKESFERVEKERQQEEDINLRLIQTICSLRERVKMLEAKISSPIPEEDYECSPKLRHQSQKSSMSSIPPPPPPLPFSNQAMVANPSGSHSPTLQSLVSHSTSMDAGSVAAQMSPLSVSAKPRGSVPNINASREISGRRPLAFRERRPMIPQCSPSLTTEKIQGNNVIARFKKNVMEEIKAFSQLKQLSELRTTMSVEIPEFKLSNDHLAMAAETEVTNWAFDDFEEMARKAAITIIPHTHTFGSKAYKKCFSGGKLLLWMLGNEKEVSSIEIGEHICQMMLDHSLIIPAFRTAREKKENRMIFNAACLYHYKSPLVILTGDVGARRRRRKFLGGPSNGSSEKSEFKNRKMELVMIEGKYKLQEYQQHDLAGHSSKPVHSLGLKNFTLVQTHRRLKKDKDGKVFIIKGSGITIEYQAPSKEQRNQWETALRKCCGVTKQRKLNNYSNLEFNFNDDSESVSHSKFHPQAQVSRGHPRTYSTEISAIDKDRREKKLPGRAYKTLPIQLTNNAFPQSFTVFSGTWNCNAQLPSMEILEKFVSGTSGSAAPGQAWEGADLYLIGLQETVELKAKELLLNRDVSRPWQKAIERALHKTAQKKAPFHLVVKIHLVGMLLLVYATERLRSSITSVEEYTIGVGVMGVGGNKGSVAARFHLFGHKIMVLNCHLTAHQQNVEGRNRDLHKIWKKFGVDTAPDVGGGGDELIFVLGDLNYRLDIKDSHIVYKLIRKCDWESLLVFEQLTRQRQQWKVFPRFTEGEITFPPTFKFHPGTDMYHEKRVPAWCDRILWWRNNRTCLVTQHWYKGLMEIIESDHKPVVSFFEVTLRFEQTKSTGSNRQRIFSVKSPRKVPLASTPPASCTSSNYQSPRSMTPRARSVICKVVDQPSTPPCQSTAINPRLETLFAMKFQALSPSAFSAPDGDSSSDSSRGTQKNSQKRRIKATSTNVQL